MQKDMYDNGKIRFTLLGTGTSSGVPTIGCDCKTCTSEDPKDKRLRCSLLIETPNTTVIIDTSSDFRQQMLKHNVKKIDAVLYTHHHFDHIGGFDDIRAFNFVMRRSIPIYIMEKTYHELKRAFIYAFEEPEQIGGGVPVIDVHFVHKEAIVINELEIKPIILYHGKLEVLGFRIGDFAYCTDTNYIPEESLKQLEGVRFLILDALRYRPHSTHFNIEEALAVVDKLKPEMTYLTHIAHQIKHADAEKELPPNVRIGYDGLVIEM